MNNKEISSIETKLKSGLLSCDEVVKKVATKSVDFDCLPAIRWASMIQKNSLQQWLLLRRAFQLTRNVVRVFPVTQVEMDEFVARETAQ